MMKEGENSGESSGRRIDENPYEEMEFRQKGIDFLGEKSSDKVEVMAGFDENTAFQSVKNGNFGSQELTLSYLCETAKMGFTEKNLSLLNSFEKMNTGYKRKEEVFTDTQNEETGNNVCVERDFLQLNENRGNSLKREAENGGENLEKKTKVDSLNLSLALPDVSLYLERSNQVQNRDFPSRLRSSRSVQSLGPSYNNTQKTYSNDFTATSLSYSHSHPFSHNPSCSFTRNSVENFEYSMGSHRREGDLIWNCGDGTNGSVHSRFRPIGDGTVALSSHGGGGGFGFGNSHKDSGNNSLYRTTSSDNCSFLPSELPAKPGIDAVRDNSKGRGGMEDLNGERSHALSMPERILKEVVSEPIPTMCQIVQDLTDETVEATKEYLKNLITAPERKGELVDLQNRLERRSDLTSETLTKCHKTQLEILVAIKMGVGNFLSRKSIFTTVELVEIFSLERCRNINCKRLLPVDDCDCKICSAKKGFCSECMCPVCLNFDSASNTCSWVGCDVCSHWCHAACGLERRFIKPGPSLKGPSGTTEMQFHCPGCSHASEMFGFVKDVFVSCAHGWSLETLMKELDCVRKIFKGSEDRKGKELHVKADEMLPKLENKIMVPSDVCGLMFQFFKYSDGLSDLGPSSISSKDLTDQAFLGKADSAFQLYNSVGPKTYLHSASIDPKQSDTKMPFMSEEKIVEDEWSVKPAKKDGFDSLESLIRIKEVESRMFQSRADEARREAENFRQMVRMQTDKLEQEYAEKLAKLCLQETEERRRKKLEELKLWENSQCVYHKMKLRIQSEIAGLLQRMETTKQQLV